MKHKFKILTATAALSITAPLLTYVTSCGNKDYKSQAEFLKEETLKEFYNICPIYRETFKTRKICDYLKQRIKDFGLDHTMIEDDYRAESEEISSGNLTFEIPATRGHENDPKIILQDHMDMVCNLKETSPGVPIEYDWETNGVIPVREGDLIHSKNYCTTLGADNGIGLCLLLALAKNRNSFSHGPIRFIITADEEDGESGAKSVSKDWLDAPYVLNLDGEDQTELTTSCAGAQDVEFSNENLEAIDTPTVETHETGSPNVYQYMVQVEGLTGGHSAMEISGNKINAIKFMAELLLFIENRPTGHPVYLTGISSLAGTTNIPDSITFTFATATKPYKEGETREGTIDSDIYDYFVPYQQFLHPIEGNLEEKVTLTDITESETYKKDKSLTMEDSVRVLKLVDLIPFGVLYYNPTTGDIETCANIAGIVGANSLVPDKPYFCLEPLANSNAEQKFRLNFAVQGRSANIDHLGKEPTGTSFDGFLLYYKNLSEHIFDTGGANLMKGKSWIPPWPYKSTKLWTTIMNAGKSEGVTALTPKGVVAWAEVAYFAHTKSDLQIACIGCQIDDAHKITETVHVSTIQTMAYNVLYTLDNLPKV